MIMDNYNKFIINKVKILTNNPMIIFSVIYNNKYNLEEGIENRYNNKIIIIKIMIRFNIKKPRTNS